MYFTDENCKRYNPAPSTISKILSTRLKLIKPVYSNLIIKRNLKGKYYFIRYIVEEGVRVLGC